jgi:8-hydroxy-5-deazaflavin:NADPH oxidoreductase
MNISILGTGNMASGLAVLFSKSGQNVTLAARDPAKAQAVAAELGHDIKADTVAKAAS